MAALSIDALPEETPETKSAIVEKGDASREAPLLTSRQLAASKNDPMKDDENVELLLGKHAGRIKFLLKGCEDLVSVITRKDGKPGDCGLLYDDIFALRYCLSFSEDKEVRLAC